MISTYIQELKTYHKYSNDCKILRGKLTKSYTVQDKMIITWLTLLLWVLMEDSVAKPFPQIAQWKGRFFSLSSCDSWFRKCCCKFDNWIKALPQSGTWHLYGRSPAKILILASTNFKRIWIWQVLLEFGTSHRKEFHKKC